MATTGANISHFASQMVFNKAALDALVAKGAGCAVDFKNPPKINKLITMTSAGIAPAKNMVLMGTRATIAYMMSGTEGASNTPKALALLTRAMPFFSG